MPFDRLGAEQSEVQGTGLGLALSKGLMEAMGGTLGAHSVQGEGTTFTLDLALAEDQPASQQRLPAARVDSKHQQPDEGGARSLRD